MATPIVDLKCVLDADPFFTTATGLTVLVQDAIHVITTDNFLPSPEGDGRGYDVRKTIGMRDADLPAAAITMTARLQEDSRLQNVRVTLVGAGAGEKRDIYCTVAFDSDFGAFNDTFSVTEFAKKIAEGNS